MKTRTNDFSTFREIIDTGIETGQTTRKAIGIAAEADDDMVRRWLGGQLPKLKNLRAILASPILPAPLVDSIADWFARRTHYRMIRAAEVDRTTLDHDANGIVDANDTLAFGIAALCKGGEAMDEIVSRAVKGKLNESDKATVRSVLYDQKAHIEKQLLTLEEPPMRLAR